jgi:hypothetical protein
MILHQSTMDYLKTALLQLIRCCYVRCLRFLRRMLTRHNTGTTQLLCPQKLGQTAPATTTTTTKPPLPSLLQLLLTLPQELQDIIYLHIFPSEIEIDPKAIRQATAPLQTPSGDLLTTAAGVFYRRTTFWIRIDSALQRRRALWSLHNLGKERAALIRKVSLRSPSGFAGFIRLQLYGSYRYSPFPREETPFDEFDTRFLRSLARLGVRRETICAEGDVKVYCSFERE